MDYGLLFWTSIMVGLLAMLIKMLIDNQRTMRLRTEHIGRIADASERIANSLEKKK